MFRKNEFFKVHIALLLTKRSFYYKQVFQRRMDGSEDFYRNFSDYVRGFGKLTGEFWLGEQILITLFLRKK